MKPLINAYGKNIVMQKAGENKQLISVDEVVDSWNGAINLAQQGDEGLRTPQIGALFAIKAHWTVSQAPATVVMPTGTGKTETMIAAIVSERVKRTLVIVPSDLLRKQTASKFLTFGILPDRGVIAPSAIPPAVAVLSSTPKSEIELSEIIGCANIIVSTVTLLQPVKIRQAEITVRTAIKRQVILFFILFLLFCFEIRFLL